MRGGGRGGDFCFVIHLSSTSATQAESRSALEGMLH